MFQFLHTRPISIIPNKEGSLTIFTILPAARAVVSRTRIANSSLSTTIFKPDTEKQMPHTVKSSTATVMVPLRLLEHEGRFVKNFLTLSILLVPASGDRTTYVPGDSKNLVVASHEDEISR